MMKRLIFLVYTFMALNVSWKVASQDVVVSIPAQVLFTGEEFTAKIKISPRRLLPEGKEAVYYIVDWGDGTWSYSGPGLHSLAKQSCPAIRHMYDRAGKYNVRVTARSLQVQDEYFEWSSGDTLIVKGANYKSCNTIENISPISSKPSSLKYVAANIANSKNSYFKSKSSEKQDGPLYVGCLFNNIFTLERLEVKIPDNCESFPSDIAIEYTTDRGKSWQSFPKYYYLYDYSKNRFAPKMNFPNPKGVTLCLYLDGIVANGIRLISKSSSASIPNSVPEETLMVEEMRVYGSEKLFFYTSMSDTYNADLNNMWTIFGTAKTEPQIIGSLMGEIQNVSPFRTGSAMIGSTEWAEWNGLKFNFTDYKEVKEIYLNTLKRIRTGHDGWSDDEGCIWATSSGPNHINTVFGMHYSLNPIFIIAARNYLLQRNELERYEKDTDYTKFMQLKNDIGQTMRMKIDMAMSYIMNTLDGKSGVMTILDPKHNGTTSGMSSNYWDVHRAFGYKSAYENALFYASLLAYADIYEYMSLNECSAVEAQKYRRTAKEYRRHAMKVKEQYNKLFWDADKGRFIGGINIRGEKMDFGYTFVNFMALAYGVADDEKAANIYNWLDGKRIIVGDSSTGSDIYGHFKYAPRSNTIDVSLVMDENGAYYWYDHNGALPCTPGTFGGYGNQMQNGGTIFYISYYDLKARINCLGADNAERRFNVIMEEFHKDSMRRNSYSEHGEYIEGVIGEFPESGLVPYFFVDGFLGISTCAKGLKIKPSLPSDMEYAGISKYLFGDRKYSIKVSKSTATPVLEKRVGDDGADIYSLELPAENTYIITGDNQIIEE